MAPAAAPGISDEDLNLIEELMAEVDTYDPEEDDAMAPSTMTGSGAGYTTIVLK